MTDPRRVRQEPQRFPRRVLLLVTGRTPPGGDRDPLCPGAAPRSDRGSDPESRPGAARSPRRGAPYHHRRGAQDARPALLTPQTGRFHRLCADHGLTGTAFTPEQIQVIRDAQGAPVPDLRTRAEHEAWVALIRAYLEETVGPLAETYAIQAIEEVRPDSYGLAIDPQRIEIMGEGYL